MQIEHSNEIELIRQTLAGNTSAFDQLVNTHRRMDLYQINLMRHIALRWSGRVPSEIENNMNLVNLVLNIVWESK